MENDNNESSLSANFCPKCKRVKASPPRSSPALSKKGENPKASVAPIKNRPSQEVCKYRLINDLCRCIIVHVRFATFFIVIKNLYAHDKKGLRSRAQRLTLVIKNEANAMATFFASSLLIRKQAPAQFFHSLGGR